MLISSRTETRMLVTAFRRVLGRLDMVSARTARGGERKSKHQVSNEWSRRRPVDGNPGRRPL